MTANPIRYWNKHGQVEWLIWNSWDPPAIVPYGVDISGGIGCRGRGDKAMSIKFSDGRPMIDGNEMHRRFSEWFNKEILGLPPRTSDHEQPS